MSEFLSQDEVDSLLRGVNGGEGFIIESPHSFILKQEVFIIVEEHGDLYISPMLSIQKTQIEYISDNFITCTYTGRSTIRGIYHTSEDANKELVNKVEKIIKQVKQTLEYLLEVQAIAIQTS
jgi:hypothetical protein